MLASGDRYGDGRWKAASRAPPVDDLANSANVNGLTFEHLHERLLELGGANLIQDLNESSRGVADVLVALGQDLQKGCAATCSACESVQAALLSGLPFLVHQALDVLGLLDLLTTVPAARVRRHYGVALDDAELVEIGEDYEGALGPIVWHRVVVEIEAHVRGLADLDLDSLVGWKPIIGQRSQTALLVVEGLVDGARAVFDPGPLECGGGRPLHRLPIEVGEVAVAASREERIAHVADGALDAAFLVAPSDGDRTWLEAIVCRECEKRGVKPNGIPTSLDDGALEIVVEQDTRDASELYKRLDMAAHEEGHCCTGEEAQEDAPRVTQHHYEGPERSQCTADLQLVKVRPVHLSLLARQRAEPLECLRRLLRPQPSDHTTDVIGSSLVAALFEHREHPGRAQLRVLLKLLDDERHEGIDDRRSRRNDLRIHTRLPQHSLDGRMMQSELARDRADGPLLPMIEAYNFGLRLLGDHDPASSWRRPARYTWCSSKSRQARRPSPTPRPLRHPRPADRAAGNLTNRNVILILSAGVHLRRDRWRFRDARLRHWLMRHFPI